MLCGNFTWIRVSHPKILGNPLELAESPLNTLMGRYEPECLLGVAAEALPAGATRTRKSAKAHGEPGDP